MIKKKFNSHPLSVLGFPNGSVGKESACNAGDPGLIPGLGRSTREGIGYPLIFLGFLCGSDGKESTCNAGDLGSIPGLGRSPGEGKGYRLQYSALRIPWNQNSSLRSPWGHKESDMTERLSLSEPGSQGRGKGHTDVSQALSGRARATT